jgi:hypothetical protein
VLPPAGAPAPGPSEQDASSGGAAWGDPVLEVSRGPAKGKKRKGKRGGEASGGGLEAILAEHPGPGAPGGAVVPPAGPPRPDDTTFCSECGEGVHVSNRFCGSCGAKME